MNQKIKQIASILIVDDTLENLKILSSILINKGYEARPVPNGKMALRAALSYPPDLILLDISMPDLDGYEVCKALKADKTLKDIPVIFLSASIDTIDKVKAFSVGGADYITKPFQLDEVCARVETHLKLSSLITDLEKRVEEQIREITDAHMATIYALEKLTQSRDDDTGSHLERVQKYCRLLALKLSENPKYDFIDEAYIEILSNASTLHDIGKVGIPDNILLKPGKLTSAEFDEMKKHTLIGSQTLELVEKQYPNNISIKTGVEIARSHHEKWDGTGYPDGMTGDEIPFAARIMAIADVYDALKSKRCYKEPYPHDLCCSIIYEGSGVLFDPDIVEAFRRINEEFEAVWEEYQA